MDLRSPGIVEALRIPERRSEIEPHCDLDEDLEKVREAYFTNIDRQVSSTIQKTIAEQKVMAQLVTKQRLRNTARQLPTKENEVITAYEKPTKSKGIG